MLPRFNSKRNAIANMIVCGGDFVRCLCYALELINALAMDIAVFIQDLHFFVIGGNEENELILATTLQGFVDAVSLLRNNVEKMEALENIDLILLCLDEIVDGGRTLFAAWLLQLPHMYDDHMMEPYKGVPFGRLSPHVFAIADVAFREMIYEGKSNSITVDGESGAGNIEFAKGIEIDSSILKDDKSKFHLQMIAELLMCDAVALEDALLKQISSESAQSH
ncbi:Coatomer subunit zeta-1 [Camellia lanceoleosa]|uniref:Coatomer subunit zeta-1 n=1 Tax=Camellia lanceoleosa TaxID=1840588 RepID=A0ACC0J0R0_9ERIC|nr:Coatomer subunit zeta-1 [Camellia lanceoleosa]